VGVVSWGPNKCADANRYGVYARVSGSYDWIRQTMCALTDTNVCIGDNTPSPPPPSPPAPSPSPPAPTPTAPGPSPEPSSVTFDVTIQFDKYPKETGVYIADYDLNNYPFELSPGTYTISNGKKSYLNIALQEGATYWVYMTDEWGDGFCCGQGTSGYVLIKAMQDGSQIWSKKIGGYMSNGYSKLVEVTLPSF